MKYAALVVVSSLAFALVGLLAAWVVAESVFGGDRVGRAAEFISLMLVALPVGGAVVGCVIGVLGVIVARAGR